MVDNKLERIDGRIYKKYISFNSDICEKMLMTLTFEHDL